MTRTNEYHWTFGNGCHISFPNGGDPVQEPGHAFNSVEGCAAISDSAGDLLFYTDGQNLYDGNHNQINGPQLGGHSSAANSAIIVPPAGNGSLYHVFAMGTWSASDPSDNTNGVLKYTPVSVAGGVVSIPDPSNQTQDVIDPDYDAEWHASEAMGATSHTDCNKYWVVVLDANNNEWVSILIDSDLGPQPANMRRSPYGAPLPASNLRGMRISADGRYIAHANVQHPTVNAHGTVQDRSTVDIFEFDRSTGAVLYHSQIEDLGDKPNPFGLEFSNNSEHLYFSDYPRGTIHRHTIGSSATLASCDPIYNRAHPGQVGDLQMGPNGKIYATKRGQPTLISIDQPNAVLLPGNTAAQNRTAIGFKTTALQAGSGNLDLGGGAHLGLPVFTRIADDCLEDKCDRIASEVDEIIKSKYDDLRTPLPYCDDKDRAEWCQAADLPELKPVVSVVWRRDDCDDVESDDVEPLLISVGNPYSNVTFCDITIQKITVVNADGTEVPILPDGTPSVELIPIGPYCFGKIEACEFTAREFMVRTRGAIAGEYHIKVDGICFEICIHDDMSECFVMEVCRD